MAQSRLDPKWRSRFNCLVQRSRVIYTPLSLGFFGFFLVNDYQSIRTNLAGLEAGLLATLFLLVVTGHLFISLSSHFLFLSQGQSPGTALVFATHVNRLPARLIPGGVWQTVVRALDFSTQGVPKGVILRVVFLESALSAGLAGLLGAVFLLSVGGDGHAGYLALILMFAAAGLVTAPYLIGRVVPVSGEFALLPYGAAVGAFAANWIVYAAAFYLFVTRIAPNATWERTVGSYLLSWLAGFLAFFAPQGIGVFEVSVSYLLTGDLTSGLVASMFAFRLITVTSDIGLWVIYRIWLCISGILRNQSNRHSE